MPWLLNEDSALKTKLVGMTVADETNPARPVAVRFRLPETELADVTFPMVVIDHVAITKADDREHRGTCQLPYPPEGRPDWADPTDPRKSPYWVKDYPIPYNIDYQVTTYSRKAMHNMALMAELAKWNRLPVRNGFLVIPQDNTVRRLDLIGGPEPDNTKDRDGKRLFRSAYRLRVSSELTQQQIYETTRVLTVKLNLKYYLDTYGARYVA